ncbi:MAG: amino acid decarboxylase [Lachnospiraceae bacterium]|nr:amino acid decarboxylase [Lachnospiraceae bacterium]
MNTPIYDFVNEYREKKISRLHMPGHKGKAFLGCEPYDITEIAGADVLSNACGIIEESEKNASELFGTAHTFFSTEGSSLAIKTMLSLVMSDRDSSGYSCSNDKDIPCTFSLRRRPFILAARNVHKSFIYGCALLDLDVEWLYPDDFKSLCNCKVSAASLDQLLSKAVVMPVAVYLTSPDYLGFVQDIEEIAKVCVKYGVPLLVDNAHGAYTKFLNPSRHPIDLGAAMCCDSAHKTLPVLTGGAYLHISKKAPASYTELARNAMAVFASTSPSYLILQSLDLCNRYLMDLYREKLNTCIEKVDAIKGFLHDRGFVIEPSEPLKLVIDTLKSGYRGEELNELLRKYQIESEFADPEYLVMMFTPEITERDYERIRTALSNVPTRSCLSKPIFHPEKAISRCSIREAVFGRRTTIPTAEAIGHISASPSVSCPPAIPIVISGEIITKEAVRLFEYYGIDSVEVLK